MEQVKNVLNLRNESLGIVSILAKLVLDELYAKISTPGSNLLEFRVCLKVNP